MTNKFGLSERVMNYVINSVKTFPEIEKLVIFGSRAMGNFKKGSDIDLACMGDQVTQETIRKLRHQLNEELPIPYFVDVLSFKDIKNQELKSHINEYGVEVYQIQKHQM